MASSENDETEAVQNDDMPRIDFEPGACKEKMLLTTNDSYEEILEEIEDEFASSPTGEEFDKASDFTKVDDSFEEPQVSQGWRPEFPEKNVKGDMNLEEKDLHEGSEKDVNSLEWKQRKKHVFVLSEAGKPIYSRHGKEDKLVTLMGVMQALVSFVQDGNDHIRCIIAGNHTFVFNVRGPIILVAVSQGKESTPQLLMQLNYVHSQIVSVLTHTQLTRILEQRRNFDLRRLLTGSEKFIDNLLDMMDSDPSFMLGAVRCLPLPGSIRDSITQAIIQACCKVKNLVFAILLVKEQLVSLVRMKKYYVHPADLHLIINMVCTSESFKTAELWMPICLPRFDSSGFLHAHVSYLNDDCPACLLLLTTDPDMFFTLSDCKLKIVEKLQRSGNCLQAINQSFDQAGYSVEQLEVPDLRHFIYKSKSTAQFTSPRIEIPYVSQEERERLFELYVHMHHRIHNVNRPLKILYHSSPKETLMGWVTPGFELYVTCEPLATKGAVIEATNKILRWIKEEEIQLFILTSPVFK